MKWERLFKFIGLWKRGEFFLSCEYVESKLNVSDRFTRESPGLETSLTDHAFQTIWDKFGPFQWDLMPRSVKVNKNKEGKPLSFFSRYNDE